MDQTHASEWSRAISYNTANCADYDIVEMLTVREGRRIVGRDSVRMADIVRGRRPADAIYDALSDYDPHARCFTDLARLGVLPQHAPCRFACIPYGSLLPEALENLLVVGKALSADQDGFNHLRMCPDVMSIGWIAGFAAAKARRDGRALPDVDLSDLRQMLYQKGALLQPPTGQESFANTAQGI
ncbi:MAG TPA: FAD-dependent oxidoreductase, partial [Clostridia bacterium]|nr:FAD-dependent oxidoreductase [Clostridia bacterium]